MRSIDIVWDLGHMFGTFESGNIEELFSPLFDIHVGATLLFIKVVSFDNTCILFLAFAGSEKFTNENLQLRFVPCFFDQPPKKKFSNFHPHALYWDITVLKTNPNVTQLVWSNKVSWYGSPGYNRDYFRTRLGCDVNSLGKSFYLQILVPSIATKLYQLFTILMKSTLFSLCSWCRRIEEQALKNLDLIFETWLTDTNTILFYG